MACLARRWREHLDRDVMEAAVERSVMVWNKPCRVAVFQESKSVWIAVGMYLGDRIEAKDRSEATALKRWREAATHRGN